MKILALSELFRVTRGGPAAHVRNLCRQLARQGHEVHLVTEQDENTGTASGGWRSLDGYWLRSAVPGEPLDGLTRVGRRRLSGAVQLQLKQLLAELCPDVVHVLNGFTLAHILSHVPDQYARIWTIYNVPPQEYSFTRFASVPPLNEVAKRVYYRLARAVHSRTLRKLPYHRLICISHQTRQLALEAGAAPERASVVPIGVDHDIFSPMPVTSEEKQALIGRSSPLLLTVAGVISHKGQLDVVEALPSIKRALPEVRYVNIGAVREEWYYQRIKARIQDLGLVNHCQFVGHVSQQEMIRHYHACDIYIQPSHHEGFCIAALEAISCGKPVVGTHVGAIAELVQGADAGTIIPPGQPAEIARAVLQLAQSPVVKDPQAQHAYIAQNYSWEAIARRTVALYEDACHHR